MSDGTGQRVFFLAEHSGYPPASPALRHLGDRFRGDVKRFVNTHEVPVF